MIQPFSSQKTVKLTMGQALVKFLQAQYSERDGLEQRFIQAIWGIFGHGNVSGLSQALVECGQDLPYHQPRNEQSMVHAAAGFAKAKERLATMACTSSIGPGATNMITGAAAATVNRLPILLLPSDYYATRFQGQVLQDIEDQISNDISVTDCFRVVSRFYDRITRPEQLLYSLPEAMRVLADPADTGAVTVALPQDIQSVSFDYPTNFFEKRVWHIERSLPTDRQITEAVKLIRDAKRPYIIAGGGVHYAQAWDDLAALAEAIGAPVGETHAGRGAIRNDYELLLYGTGHVGTPVAGEVGNKADLVIAVGTRLADFTTGSNSHFQHPGVRFISINVNSHDAHKNGGLPIVADARTALTTLTQACKSAGVQPNEEYREEVLRRKQAWAEELRTDVFVEREGELLSQGHLVGLINEAAQPGDVVVAAAGTGVGDIQKIWDASNNRQTHLEFGYSCMSYDIPAALGVRMAQSEGEVYVLLGDGGYLMNPTELVTATQEGLKVTVILSENHGFQSINGHQKALVGHPLGNEFRMRDSQTGSIETRDWVPIDLAKNAESMGARTWTARTSAEVCQALGEARREDRTCVIVVPTEPYRRLPDSLVWWDVFGAEVTADSKTAELVAAREEGRKNQRFYW